MNKGQVLELIQKIEMYFNNPFTKKRNAFNEDKTDEEIILDVVNAWYDILKDYEAETVFNNFKEYVKTNRYAPTIADLIKEQEKILDPVMTVPSREETQVFLRKMDEWEKRAQTPEAIEAREKALAEIRKKLDIE
jgi:hypothetical protein